MGYDDIFSNFFTKELYDLEEEKDNFDYIINGKDIIPEELGKSSNIVIEKYTDEKEIRRLKAYMETLMQIRKLQKIKEAIGDRDPKKIEDDYFSKFNCYTEKQRLVQEINFIIDKLKKNEEKYKSNPRYDIDLFMINKILESLDSYTNKDLGEIKQILVLIELDFKIDIAFVSEVDNVYKLKLEKFDNEDKKKKGL